MSRGVSVFDPRTTPCVSSPNRYTCMHRDIAGISSPKNLGGGRHGGAVAGTPRDRLGGPHGGAGGRMHHERAAVRRGLVLLVTRTRGDGQGGRGFGAQG